MDQQQIDTLHQEASELYVQGDYKAALQAWNRLLKANPNDEKAKEGARLCEMMGLPGDDEPVATGSVPMSEEQYEAASVDEPLFSEDGEEEELLPLPEVGEEEDLLPLGVPELELPGEEKGGPLEADAEEGGEDLELDLALDNLDTKPVRDEAEDRAIDLDLLPEKEPPDQQEPPVLMVQPEEETGALEPREVNAAEVELRRRVEALLRQAADEDEAGNSEEALSILSRLYILDENHEGARVLEETIRQKMGREAGELDDKVAEAVLVMQQDKLEEARALFQEVLESAPYHQEAQAYIAELDDRIASADQAAEPDDQSPAADDLEGLPLGDFEAESTRDAVQDHGSIALDEGGEEQIETAAPMPLEPEGTDLEQVEAAPRKARPVEVAPAGPAVDKKKGLVPILLAACLVVVLGAAGAYLIFFTDLLGMRLKNASAPESAAVPTEQQPAGDLSGTAQERSTEELMAEADSLSGMTPEEPVRTAAESVHDHLLAAQESMDHAEYDQAILAYNEALKLDPTNPVATAGIRQAGDHYRAYKRDLEDLERAKRSFNGGDYTSALKVLYRLPEGLEPEVVARYKVNGWYNLGIVALKAGDTAEARAHFDDALTIDPDDAGAIEAKRIAEGFEGAVKDIRYYSVVEELRFRSLDD